MTTLHRRMPSWLGRPGPAAEDEQWRNVPRISLVTEPRRSAGKLLVPALAIAILVEVLFLQFLYRDYTSSNQAVATIEADIERFQARISVQDTRLFEEEEKLGTVNEQIKSIEEQLTEFQQAQIDEAKDYERFTIRPDWANAFGILLQADGKDIAIVQVAAQPDGTIKMTGTATGVAALDGLQGHMRGVDDVLDLISLRLETQEGAQSFEAEIGVR